MCKNELLIRVTLGALAVSVLSVIPEDVGAQLANASASTIALSGNNTATVRGFGAISVNPAGLAMPGSGFSLALVPVQVRAGLGPVGLSDLADYEGMVVPVATKESWMTAIEAAGGQVGSVGADVSALALTRSPFNPFGLAFDLASGVMPSNSFPASPANCGPAAGGPEISVPDARALESRASETIETSLSF